MPYTIKKSEKISEISERFDIPYDIIWRYNPFVTSPDGIYEGKSLRLPLIHSVLPGETYESISKEYGIVTAYLVELNPYMDGHSVIYPGQTIFLPPQ